MSGLVIKTTEKKHFQPNMNYAHTTSTRNTTFQEIYIVQEISETMNKTRDILETEGLLILIYDM